MLDGATVKFNPFFFSNDTTVSLRGREDKFITHLVFVDLRCLVNIIGIVIITPSRNLCKKGRILPTVSCVIMLISSAIVKTSVISVKITIKSKI